MKNKTRGLCLGWDQRKDGGMQNVRHQGGRACGVKEKNSFRGVGRLGGATRRQGSDNEGTPEPTQGLVSAPLHSTSPTPGGGGCLVRPRDEAKRQRTGRGLELLLQSLVTSVTVWCQSPVSPVRIMLALVKKYRTDAAWAMRTAPFHAKVHTGAQDQSGSGSIVVTLTPEEYRRGTDRQHVSPVKKNLAP